MIIESWAYNNRWRWVHPGAKGLLTSGAFVAAFLAPNPWFLLALALGLALLTIWGGGIPAKYYLRVFIPPLGFLIMGAATLAISLGTPDSPWPLALGLDRTQLPRVARLGGRSLACLTSLLFLAFTTPMTDLIALLRRLKMPAILLEIMTLGYRLVFVFLTTAHDITTAQKARLGYATLRAAMRSMGSMVAVLAIQIWQRAAALEQAALSRANDGPLLFLANEFPGSGPSFVISTATGLTLIGLALMF
ncbi:MAG: cobalt ECF transporter T component CbiQ [Desulfobacca sp.]|uniref:cobalt ECF transporter T component CbiQ n=1 Tax=Desulfobacca sp. TaxID=2067990 RepID=UPI00404BA1EE